ncbi:SDR family NAD(P)-dependent oxidoreductase [Nocardioides sp.]|uniref:SDR family NAD(P)-dependent oxidoreductase n=1 Tax=Nocardioides sp. TaxID=35761 RepID=UPI003512B338
MARGRIALITGANRGIGRETARHLAERGVTVLLGCRDLDRAISTSKELAVVGADVVPVRLDVTDEASVAAATEQVSRFGRLDILVNNAAVFVGSPVLATTAEEMRTMFEVNVFGVVTVTRWMLPLLRESPAPRIVNVSSTTASLELTSTGADLPGDPQVRMAYTSSKAALNMLTIQYARAFAELPELAHVKINSVTPGYTATAMNDFQGHRNARDAAEVVVRSALLPDDGPTGRFFGDSGEVAW